ncbi:MAG: MoxR family ATPase, partial [Bdellovibrionales bacterium]|nr:MoxR family ATPase [Bdellovibrionales bacterium]
MVAILADGHVLIEGPPGVAKTRVVKTYAEALGASWNRIQFVPDMMPRDITGTLEFDSQRSERKLIGSQLPYNLIIGDEINRATPKLQAALLETMEERQFTVFGQTIKMPEFFIFLATQNPFENRGTFDLPEAQLDRFLFKLRVNFPSQENEREILKISKNEKLARLAPNQSPVSNLITESDQETILAAQSLVLQMEAPKKIEDYILLIAAVTRQPELYDGNLPLEIKMGIGPRASQSLYLASMAMAWLNSHSEVEISDVDAIAADVMRHRIVLSDEALIENTSVESIINNILSLAKKNLDGSK